MRRGSAWCGAGEWYSLVSKEEGVYWRNATVLKVINHECQSAAYDAFVQLAGKHCFSACPQPLNQSSACWVGCFFQTLLGPDADTTLKPPGKQAGGRGCIATGKGNFRTDFGNFQRKH